MVAGVRSFSLDETFIEPQVLNPPPTRHALLAVLIALSALLHIGTAGWGDLYDGAEGQFAGGAREMVQSHQYLQPTNNGATMLSTPPLLYWLVAGSDKIFGVTVFAARLPSALSMIASIALTFLIGERLAGYWRGFAAGFIHLCSLGTFVLGRMVTPDPLFAALMGCAAFCLVCGYQRRRFRRAWFAGFTACAAFACLAKGLEGLLYPLITCLFLAVFYREARLRFRALLHWSCLVVFLAIAAPWFIWAQKNIPGFVPQILRGLDGSQHSRLEFLALHLLWWFPAAFLVLPGVMFRARHVFRPHEITFADALPFCWMAAVLIPLLIMGRYSTSASMCMWSAFALWSAATWERMPSRLQITALSVIAIAGAAFAATAFFAPGILAHRMSTSFAIGTPPELLALRPLAEVAGAALAVLAGGAVLLAAKHREDLALSAVLVAMIPVGLCLAEAATRMAPFLSLAGAAQFLNPRLPENSVVYYEGSLQTGSSLTFYLNQPFSLVNQPLDSGGRTETAKQNFTENSVLEKWSAAAPVYLITDQNRLPYWQNLITARVHIYHQVTTCGRHVILSNQL